MAQELSIIIVTYNSKEVLEKCLYGIHSPEFEIIIVDNNSADGTDIFLAEKYPFIKFIYSPKNIGYGRAANLALKTVETKYALLLNPDVITTSGSIFELLDRAKQNPEAAILAPRTRDEKSYDPSKSFTYEEWISGAVMLFDMEKLRNIGLFDENIFLFNEEVDLCKRTRDKNYKIILFNDLYFEHLVGKSSLPDDKITSMKYWHMAWSRYYYNSKHLTSIQHYIKGAASLLKYIFKLLIYIIKSDRPKTLKYKGLLTGSISYILGKPAFDSKGNPNGIKL